MATETTYVFEMVEEDIINSINHRREYNDAKQMGRTRNVLPYFGTTCCPIALTIKKVLPELKFAVHSNRLFYKNDYEKNFDKQWVEIKFNRIMEEFVENFDDRKPVKPINFTLNIIY